MNDYNNPQQQYQGPQVALPNATSVLILGIISIVACCCYGGGLILGIIALILAAKDRRRYADSPSMYTRSSYNNLNAGRICAIIAIVFSVLYIVFMIAFIGVIGLENMQNPEKIQEALQNL